MADRVQLYKNENYVEEAKPPHHEYHHQDGMFSNVQHSRAYYIVNPQWLSEAKVTPPKSVPMKRPPWPWEQPKYRVNMIANNRAPPKPHASEFSNMKVRSAATDRQPQEVEHLNSVFNVSDNRNMMNGRNLDRGRRRETTFSFGEPRPKSQRRQRDGSLDAMKPYEPSFGYRDLPAYNTNIYHGHDRQFSCENTVNFNSCGRHLRHSTDGGIGMNIRWYEKHDQSSKF